MNRHIMQYMATPANYSYGACGSCGGASHSLGYSTDWDGLTLREAGAVAVRQLTAAPYLTAAGAVAGLLLVDRANKAMAAQKRKPVKKRATKLTQNQAIGLVAAGAVLVNLTHILSSLGVAAAD